MGSGSGVGSQSISICLSRKIPVQRVPHLVPAFLHKKKAALEKVSQAMLGQLRGGHYQWQSRSIETRRKLGMGASLMPWDSLARRQYAGCPQGARVRDCINVCWFKLRQKSQKSSKDLAAFSFCNISQCVSRLPCSETCSPCFTSSSVVYSYAHDTVITGACQLRGMGHSRASMPMGSFDDGTCRNLAGDSFSVPIASLLTTACALNPFASWW